MKIEPAKTRDGRPARERAERELTEQQLKQVVGGEGVQGMRKPL